MVVAAVAAAAATAAADVVVVVVVVAAAAAAVVVVVAGDSCCCSRPTRIYGLSLDLDLPCLRSEQLWKLRHADWDVHLRTGIILCQLVALGMKQANENLGDNGPDVSFMLLLWLWLPLLLPL